MQFLIPIGDNSQPMKNSPLLEMLPSGRLSAIRYPRFSIWAACFSTFALLLLLISTSAVQAQQALDETAVPSTLDSPTRVVAETPYAIATRDGNQKTWSKVTWESNSVTGELIAKTNSFI